MKMSIKNSSKKRYQDVGWFNLEKEKEKKEGKKRTKEIMEKLNGDDKQRKKQEAKILNIFKNGSNGRIKKKD